MNFTQGMRATRRREVSAADAALDFLDALGVADPSIADAALTREVDDLLGREPTQAQRRARPEPGPVGASRGRSDEKRFDWYAQLLSRLPLLDDSTAFDAASRVEAGLYAKEHLGHLDPATTPRRLLADLHTLAEDGQEAWQWLILANLRLAFHWSKGVARSISPMWAEDAFQAAILGLMRGLQSWDHRKGYKLSTYVSWHIRQAVQRWRANEVQIIRLPVHVWEALNSDDDRASDELRAVAARAQNLVSLSAMVERGEDVTWDGGFAIRDEELDREWLTTWLLDGLDERSLDVIQRRFALRDDIDEPMTLDEIGAHWGVTRERIRQIERKTLEALRQKAAGAPLPWLDVMRARH